MPNPSILPTLGLPEVALILIVLILLLSPWRLPQLARAIGESIREFRSAKKGVKQEEVGKTLIELAEKLGVETEGKSIEQIAEEVRKKLSR
jgi:sec-independent protein translocase protein TatA